MCISVLEQQEIPFVTSKIYKNQFLSVYTILSINRWINDKCLYVHILKPLESAKYAIQVPSTDSAVNIWYNGMWHSWNDFTCKTLQLHNEDWKYQ